MATIQKNALGAFPDLQQLESALGKLQATGFPMQQVATIVQKIEPEAAQELAAFETAIAEPHETFAPDRQYRRLL